MGGLGDALAGLRSLGASRSTLGFSGASGPSSVIPMAEALMEKLKELYRQALRKLEAEGRIDEAAFVLAELLNEPGEAVALLERHERWARAAELAEVKELSPDLAVRLWFLAKDVDRAILAARRRGGMAGALVRLEAQDKVAARRLRLVWAATLAATGRPGAAVDLLADVAGTEALVEKWLDAAIEGGGPPGAKALRLALERRPEQWEPLYETAREWLDGPARPLQHLSSALCDSDHDVASPLVRHAARQLLRQRVRRGSDVDLDALLQRARKRAGGAMSVDTPRDPVAVTPLLATRSEPRVERFDAAGAAAPSAVRWLPRQRLLVARGESGLELRARDGRLLRRWEQPVHELAVHEAGTEAIGLGHRGSIRLLCRIDLTTFQGGFWTEANIERFMPTYCDPWVVTGDREVMAIDVADRGFRRTWRVSTTGPVEALSMGAMLSYLADGEIWVRRMPDLALHARNPDNVQQVLGMATPALEGLSNGEREFIVPQAKGWRWQGPQGTGLQTKTEVLAFTSSPRWTALATEGEVVLAVRNQPAVRLRLELPGGRPQMFLDDDHLVVWDDLGRVVVAELVHGDIVCDLRI